ncbi:TetR family transcriptional regulator [Sorangium cellulosum]|uniref:TetR family transcriptional regulator n=1 Tax=Sorangium cellulosum TaxID=56 RepID=A0A150PRV9_SORCE|nr:TetR family transcriptional regulator [Sorangium cellulosum]
MSARTYPSARDRILDAAERLVVARGVKSLTVEAVITEAQISKGGFFHHFATKDALLTAIIDRLSKRVTDDAAERAARDPEPRGARLRAQIALAFDAGKLETAAPRALLLALIEAVGAQPEIARHIIKVNAETFARDVAEDISEGRAIAIQFALDGFWFSQALGTAALTEGQRQALRDALLALAQPEAGAGRGPTRPRGSRKGGRA